MIDLHMMRTHIIKEKERERGGVPMKVYSTAEGSGGGPCSRKRRIDFAQRDFREAASRMVAVEC